jgi:RimJ/RimL family protein N-acetyltransferase
MMVIVARTPEDKAVALRFLNDHGVNVAMTNDFNAFGRIDSARNIMGVVAYNSFNCMTCAMHVAGDGNWISRELIREAFGYPFKTCELNHIVVTASAKNHRSNRLIQRMGFEFLAKLPQGWSETEDMLIYSMDKAGCRWLAQENQDELQAA